MSSLTSSAAEYDYVFKIVLVGTTCGGKSALQQRFTGHTFGVHPVTIGIDFRLRTIELDGKTIKLQIWDCAGQERFRTQVAMTYRGAHGIMIVYDITSQYTFEDVDRWRNEVDTQASDSCLRMVVGSKLDLENKRQVEYKTAKAYAEKHSMRYIETSALTPTNVEKAFLTMAADIKQRMESDQQQQQHSSSKVVNLTSSNSTASSEGSCCY